MAFMKSRENRHGVCLAWFCLALTIIILVLLFLILGLTGSYYLFNIDAPSSSSSSPTNHSSSSSTGAALASSTGSSTGSTQGGTDGGPGGHSNPGFGGVGPENPETPNAYFPLEMNLTDQVTGQSGSWVPDPLVGTTACNASFQYTILPDGLNSTALFIPCAADTNQQVTLGGAFPAVNYTVMVWVKITAPSPLNNDYILLRTLSVGNGLYADVFTGSESEPLVVTVWMTGSVYPVVSYSATSGLADNQWMHVAVTYNTAINVPSV